VEPIKGSNNQDPAQTPTSLEQSASPLQDTMQSTTRYAGVIVRWAAFSLDTLIVAIPWALLSYAVSVVARIDLPDISGLLLFVYLTLLIGKRQTTPGKSFFHLRVEGKDGKMDYGRALLREVVGRILSWVVLGLGYLWIIWDKEKQGWHDKIANTHVVLTAPVSKGRMVLAYILTIALPILAIVGIAAVIVLFAIDPAKQIERARQTAEESERRMLERQRELEQVESEFLYEYSPDTSF
jgi:uncharacterized RDD family membrane protein YckC